VGVGVCECVGVGDGDADADRDEEADGEDVADFDGDGVADLVGVGDGGISYVGTRAGVGRVVGSGDGERRGLGLGGASLLAGGVLAGGAGVLWRGAARARTACTPVTVISVALVAATIHNARAATAVAAPGLARILLHPKNVLARCKPVSLSAPARRPSGRRGVAAGLAATR